MDNECSRGAINQRFSKAKKEDFDPSIGAYQEIILHKGVAFSIVPVDAKVLAQVKDLGYWIDRKAIKMRVNNQDLDLLSKDEGGGDRAIVGFVGMERCEIQVVSVSMDRVFNVTCSIKGNCSIEGNGATIDKIQEINKDAYLKQYRDEFLGEEFYLSPNQSPVNYDNMAFRLLRTNELSLPYPHSLEEMINAKSLKIQVNGKELELALTDVGGKEDRAIVYAMKADQCKVRIVSTSMKRIFEITLSTKLNRNGTEREIVIENNVEETPLWEYACEFDNMLRGFDRDCSLSIPWNSHSLGVKYCLPVGCSDVLINFTLKVPSHRALVQAKNLEQLIKGNNLKIIVNDRELEIKPRDCGSNGVYAVIHSVKTNQCVFRVFYTIASPYQQKYIFDITVLTSDRGEICIDSVKEISDTEYSKQKSEAWTEKC